MRICWRIVWMSVLLCAAANVAAEEANEDSQRRSVSVFGRGLSVDGDGRKFREDYDYLQSGGGVDFLIEDERDQGVYLTVQGSVLLAERGDDVDGTELSFKAGRRGKYHFGARVSLQQSFYDDSYEGPLGAAFPRSNALARDLHTNRADIDANAQILFGDRGVLEIRYRHDEMEGERSILKGSVVEDLSVFSFQAPGFQELDWHSDSVDAHLVVQADPVRLVVDGGYRRRESGVATNEINFAADRLRDRVRFEDAFDVDVAHGGVHISTTGDSHIQGHAGYRIAYVNSNGMSAQRGGRASLESRRAADRADVESLTQTGHAGVVMRPLPGLALRASYSIRDRDRTGDGEENRIFARRTGMQRVRNDTQKDRFTHRPRLSLTYTGIARTRLRASYDFDKTSRDLDLRSLVDGDGPAAIDRIQKTDEDIYTHRARVGARSRIGKRVTGEVGYDLMRQQIDQEVRELVNEIVLGDRERERDRVFAKVRLRARQRSSVELGGEWDRAEFRRENRPRDSSTKSEGYRVNAQANAMPFDRFSLHGAVSYADLEYTVGADTPRTLSVFRDVEFRNRYVSGTALAAWKVSDSLSLRGRYTLAHVSGSLDNLSSRVHFDASLRPAPRIRIASGYAYLGFDEDLYSGDDFDGHFAWARLELSF